jgi:hypothetical protein
MSVVDRSIVNRLQVKRLTAAVIETYGGIIDQTSSARWHVSLPPELSRFDSGTVSAPKNSGTGDDELDSIAASIQSNSEEEEPGDASESATLVFDPREEDSDDDDIVVRPGTPFFNSVLELARSEDNIVCVHLGVGDFQIDEPPTFEVLDRDTRIVEFNPQSSKQAVAFHFHLKFDSVTSYTEEQFETVTLSLENDRHLSSLTGRLEANLDRLVTASEGIPLPQVGQEEVDEVYEKAVGEVKTRTEETITALREEATEAVEERSAEIRDLYEQRREELESKLTEKRAEIRDWAEKEQRSCEGRC